MSAVTVIGAGLAGCEAAWQLAEKGIDVTLWEMKPIKRTPAHHVDTFAELVCSNSFRAAGLSNAVGLLKEELRRAGSLIMSCADATAVEAGGALAVDREGFSAMVTEKIKNHPHITVREGEVTAIPAEGRVIVASGPLTSDALSENIRQFFGGAEYLNFFDAAAPLVSFESVDMESAWFASRYDKGTPDYINCPLSKEEYMAFWERLCGAQEAPVHGFEDAGVFEGCMPVEVMARRGVDTLRFGPMKPVGLKDPKTGKEPYAVLQLRKDNSEGSIYNLVGCQTHLLFCEQKAVFSMIPALKNAEYLRFGVMHRNTYIDSPRLLDRWYRARKDTRVSFAGQMTGVEGYVESTASGLFAALAAAAEIRGETLPQLSKNTAIGALSLYVSDESVANFQPMNVNFGIISPLGYKVRGKQQKNLQIAQRALAEINGFFGIEEEPACEGEGEKNEDNN
ncbi:MAG: methylenetetrahydrofolate--tRNA-(uracil(54)-C(5))-methyltransferase (FADH(2)-oxidizing) TrmFO [Oscillospiraceae bacterium]|nr:methylenetetrahydrofolate--tRNA-(uracil(54)-C(5))-methyltransferase (FADH(2)-oxidizing) TrmFO [Oscillospiraceae bacterium]